jgi:hypothetical protein
MRGSESPLNPAAFLAGCNAYQAGGMISSSGAGRPSLVR